MFISIFIIILGVAITLIANYYCKTVFRENLSHTFDVITDDVDTYTKRPCKGLLIFLDECYPSYDIDINFTTELPVKAEFRRFVPMHKPEDFIPSLFSEDKSEDVLHVNGIPSGEYIILFTSLDNNERSIKGKITVRGKKNYKEYISVGLTIITIGFVLLQGGY